MKTFSQKVKSRIFKNQIGPNYPKKRRKFREPIFTSSNNRKYQDVIAQKMQEFNFIGLEFPPRPKWERIVASCAPQDMNNLLSLLVNKGFEVIVGSEGSFYFVGLSENAQFSSTKEAGLILFAHEHEPDDGKKPSSEMFIRSHMALNLRSELRLKIENYEFPIDAVYLWVDGSDANWIEKFNLAKNINTSTDRHGIDKSRFLSFNEIEHSIKSLSRNAPWISKIYIVTDRQHPNLPKTFENIRIVDHTEIIPQKFLPTFNSNVISLYLKNIPGLSEHFLYLNDDVFLGKPTEPSYFFDSNGLSKVRLTRTRIPIARKLNVLHEARANTVRISSAHNLLTSDRSICHGPHAMRIEILKKIHEKFKTEIEETSKNCFRSKTDLVVEWLYFFYSYTNGMSTYETATDYAYVNINSKGQDGDISKVLRRQLPRIFSLNQVAELPEEFRENDKEIAEKLALVWNRLESSNLSEVFD